VRTSLWRQDLLRTQLRPSCGCGVGQCKIMVPMIAVTKNCVRWRAILDEERAALGVSDEDRAGSPWWRRGLGHFRRPDRGRGGSSVDRTNDLTSTFWHGSPATPSSTPGSEGLHPASCV